MMWKAVKGFRSEYSAFNQYFLFAKEFGFTPREVDEMSIEEVEFLSMAIEEYHKEERRQIELARRGVR